MLVIKKSKRNIYIYFLWRVKLEAITDQNTIAHITYITPLGSRAL